MLATRMDWTFSISNRQQRALLRINEPFGWIGNDTYGGLAPLDDAFWVSASIMFYLKANEMKL